MIAADHPWKEVCEKKLALVLALLFPQVHALIDWAHDYEPLDHDLRKLAPSSRAGGRIADRLIKAVALGTGDPRYFHLEVQGKRERGFRRRIHLCNLRAEERFDAHVVSLLILTDENPRWRPSRYVAGVVPAAATAEKPALARRQRYQDERTLRFLTVKLIDFRSQEAQLQTLDNPMGLFVLAHLEALRTRRDAEARQQAKLQLLRWLRLRKMDVEDTRFWHTCLDWFLQLPAQGEQAIRQELERLDMEENMPYLSFLERHALEQGLEKGLEQGLEKGLEQGLEKGLEQGLEKGLEQGLQKGRLETLAWYLKAKYGEEALGWLTAVQNLKDETQLHQLCEQIFAATTAEQVRVLLTGISNGNPSA